MMREYKPIAIVALAVALLAGCAGARIRPPRGAAQQQRLMLTTGYCSCQKCAGWHRNIFLQPVHNAGPNKGKRKAVGVTASGTKARKGTIAADVSLYPYGTVMYIPGYGYGRVEDRGGAVRGDHVDLYFRRHKDALRWGKQKKRVQIWPSRRN